MTPAVGPGRKRELLEAGKKLIFHEGPGRFTMRRLAEMVGVTEPAVYRHFKNKEEMLLELIHFMFEGWEEKLEGLRLQQISGSEKLIRLGKFHLNHLIKHDFNPVVLVVEASTPNQPRLGHALSEKGGFITRTMSAIIVEAQKKGEFAGDLNVRAATLALMGILQGSLLRWTLTRSTVGLASDVEGAIKLVVKAFSK